MAIKFNLFGPSRILEEEKKKIEEFESKISEKLDVAMQKDLELDRLKGEKQMAIEGLQKDNIKLKEKIKELENLLFEEKKKKHVEIQAVVGDRAEVVDKLKLLEDEKKELDSELDAVKKEKEDIERDRATLEKEKLAVENELDELAKEKASLEKERQKLFDGLEIQKQKVVEEKDKTKEKIGKLNGEFSNLKLRYKGTLEEEQKKARELLEAERAEAE